MILSSPSRKRWFQTTKEEYTSQPWLGTSVTDSRNYQSVGKASEQSRRVSDDLLQFWSTGKSKHCILKSLWLFLSETGCPSYSESPITGVKFYRVLKRSPT